VQKRDSFSSIHFVVDLHVQDNEAKRKDKQERNEAHDKWNQIFKTTPDHLHEEAKLLKDSHEEHYFGEAEQNKEQFQFRKENLHVSCFTWVRKTDVYQEYKCDKLEEISNIPTSEVFHLLFLDLCHFNKEQNGLWQYAHLKQVLMEFTAALRVKQQGQEGDHVEQEIDDKQGFVDHLGCLPLHVN